MGRHTDSSPNQPPGHRPQATSEQLRLARLTQDPTREDQDLLRENVRKVMELTQCTESAAQVAIHDCDNDVSQAVTLLLDGGAGKDEWIEQKGKKGRRTQHENQEEDGEMESPTPEKGPVERPSTRWRGGAPQQSFGDRPERIRNGPTNTDSQPPRFRQRGGPNIGGNIRQRRENRESDENEQSSEFGARGRGRGPRDSSERGRGSRGRGRGGGGRGGERGGFSTSGIGTWAPPPAKESNTWDNSMARNVGRPQPAPTSDNMWDNSMAAHLNQRQERLREGAGPPPAAPPAAPPGIQDDWNNATDDWNDTENNWPNKTLVIESSSRKSPTPVAPPNLAAFSSVAAPKPSSQNKQTANDTNLAGHYRGENIDVSTLLSSSTADRSNVSATTSPAGAPNATAWLKHELGIGKPSAGGTNTSTSHMVSEVSRANNKIVEFSDGLGSSGSGSMDIQFGFNIDGNVSSSAQVDYSIGTTDAIFATSQRTPAKADVMLPQNGTTTPCSNVLALSSGSATKESPKSVTTPLSSSYPNNAASQLPPLSLAQSQNSRQTASGLGAVFSQQHTYESAAQQNDMRQSVHDSYINQSLMSQPQSVSSTLWQGNVTPRTTAASKAPVTNQLYNNTQYYPTNLGAIPYMNMYSPLTADRAAVDQNLLAQLALQHQYPGMVGMDLSSLTQMLPALSAATQGQLPQAHNRQDNFTPGGTASGDLKSLMGNAGVRGDTTNTGLGVGPPPGFSQPPSQSNAAVAQAVMGQALPQPQFTYPPTMLPAQYMFMPPVSNGQSGLGATQMHKNLSTPYYTTGYDDNLITQMVQGDYGKSTFGSNSQSSTGQTPVQQHMTSVNVKQMMASVSNSSLDNKQYATGAPPTAQMNKPAAFDSKTFATNIAGTPPPAFGNFGLQNIQPLQPHVAPQGYPATHYAHPGVQLSPMAAPIPHSGAAVHLNDQRGQGVAKGYQPKGFPGNFNSWNT